ncbi:MAG TPA: 2-C-methyl-D-erythritol 2,4-cyclodiphosphate synthase [Bacteroidales bacterium]|nr:2-C-methyl-D-erythritol 2,4-cyclodiphosphate synthase [Bacteroidales bacterium]
MMFRIGFGYDVHQLVEGRGFWLGGIEIPHTKGSLGHSDGDALIHAICDAILGAANMRDIGYHFPDTSSDFKNIDSKILLKRTIDLARQKGFEIGNIDSTICLQKPKVKDYIPVMQQTLAEVLSISTNDISVKATTTEKMGFVGREEGVAVYAVVLLEKK